MGKYKVGDKVRVLHTDYPDEIPLGSVQTVSMVWSDPSDHDVRLSCARRPAPDGLMFYAEEVEPVSDDDAVLDEPSEDNSELDSDDLVELITEELEAFAGFVGNKTFPWSPACDTLDRIIALMGYKVEETGKLTAVEWTDEEPVAA